MLGHPHADVDTGLNCVDKMGKKSSTILKLSFPRKILLTKFKSMTKFQEEELICTS